MNERNVNLDLIRCLAIFSVISVHFLLHTGFYGIEIDNIFEFILIFFRTFLMICVPLFLLLTGYLMNKKILNKKYYFSICKIIFIFLMAKLFYIIIDGFYFHEIDGFLTILENIFSYSSNAYNDYSWYVNMYFGLFLLIPFLNLIYNNLENKKQKQVLIGTLFLLTSLSTLNFQTLTFFPNWWEKIYPLTYYFIGAYISEYGFNLKRSTTLCILFVVNLCSSILYYILSYDRTFISVKFNDYKGPFTFMIAILVFGFLLNLNLNNLKKIIKKIISKISELSFGVYLFSFIVDKIVYQKFNSIVLNVNDRFKYAFLVIPIIFMISLFLSFIFNTIYRKIIYSKILKISSKA